MKKNNDFLFLVVLFLMVCCFFNYSINPSPDKITEAGNLIIQSAMPSWISPVAWLSSHGLAIIAVIIIFFEAQKRHA
jgi:hypothetical protein